YIYIYIYIYIYSLLLLSLLLWIFYKVRDIYYIVFLLLIVLPHPNDVLDRDIIKDGIHLTNVLFKCLRSCLFPRPSSSSSSSSSSRARQRNQGSHGDTEDNEDEENEADEEEKKVVHSPPILKHRAPMQEVRLLMCRELLKTKAELLFPILIESIRSRLETDISKQVIREKMLSSRVFMFYLFGTAALQLSGRTSSKARSSNLIDMAIQSISYCKQIDPNHSILKLLLNSDLAMAQAVYRCDFYNGISIANVALKGANPFKCFLFSKRIFFF
ncbi:hypothetical protein RFI_05858, partial [Reticulomyxa filosa]